MRRFPNELSLSLPVHRLSLINCAACCLFILSLPGLAQAARATDLPSNDASSDIPLATEIPVLPDANSASLGTMESESTAVPSEAFADSQYLLGTGDQVQVVVFNAPDYSGEFSVLAGGVLNLPLAGEVSVEDLTLQQASEKISARLSQYIRRPRATVSLLSARPLQVAIAGQVNRPGAYTLPTEGENASPTPTLTQAISLAGGISQSADIRSISVQRQPSQATGAQPQTIEVNLWQLLQTGQLDADLPLQRGDRIIVPTAVALSPEETTQLASASFSPDTITVNVVGEVETPGAIELPPNTPLNQAILTAGGFNRRAKASTVSLIRLNNNGSVDQQKIDINFETGVDANSNPPLRPNDTIVVETNRLNRVTDTLGTVLSPINSGFGILRLLGL